MNTIKILVSFFVLLAVLSCSRINQKIEEKIYEQQRETIRKIDSVMISSYKDTIYKNLDEELKKLDSMKTGSDSSMKELEKQMKKLNQQRGLTK
jgi:type III secretory pathway component EscR